MMRFNTNDLGYKLFSGQLRDQRVHSEQLNKFVAGFFDADGSVTMRYDENPKRRRLRAEITQSNKVDKDGQLLKALCEFYDLGNIKYNKESDSHTWYMSAKQTKIFYGRIGKHLIIKNIHFQSMIDFYDNWQVEKLKELREESRRVSASMTIKKHISPAYLAGLICGDGYICVQFDKKRFNKKENREYTSNILKIDLTLHEMDKSILYAIQKDYGGKINNSGDLYRISIPMGKGSVGNYLRLKKMSHYLLLDYKYDSFQKVIEFHNQLAETKRKGL